MSIFASILRSVYKLSGAKKAFALPEDALRKEIEKQNRHRGVFTPTDRKAYYETIAVNGFGCSLPDCARTSEAVRARDSLFLWRWHGDRPR